MAEAVGITISVTPEAAAMLARPGARELVAEIANRMLAPANPGRLIQAMEGLSAFAQARGLTDAILDEELAAWEAERQTRRGNPTV